MSKIGLKKSLLITAAILVAVVLVLRDSAPKELPSILKLTPPQGSQAGLLQVPIVSYERASASNGTERVDFIGAVHLGEPAYYADLNKRFKGYDRVLFELVADHGRVEQLEGPNQDSMLGAFQRAFSQLLGLTFQLDEINYGAPNFVHADLSPTQLAQAMTARGESFATLLLKLLRFSFDPKVRDDLKRAGYEEPQLDGINPVLIALRGPTPKERARIKLFFAQGLASSDVIMKYLEGENGISLIDDRNIAALDILRQQLKAGQKHLGIFYGVGHLPDMHERLTQQLGFKIVEIEWVTAWML